LTVLLLALACGRTGLGTAQQNAGGNHGPEVADAGGAPTSTGGTTGTSSGPCGEATCLSSLFATCVPAGSCARHGAGSGNASALDACYANGITLRYVGGWNGKNVTTELIVSRRGVSCYTISSIDGATSSSISYVISGPSGQVATAVTADKAGAISVTCQGGKPVLAEGACLRPVSTDVSGCDLEECP
jgi:hypothetical protein